MIIPPHGGPVRGQGSKPLPDDERTVVVTGGSLQRGGAGGNLRLTRENDMKYGDKRDYRKIDIFTRHWHGKKSYFAYAASTTWAATCKEAKQRFYESRYPNVALSDIRCWFAR